MIFGLILGLTSSCSQSGGLGSSDGRRSAASTSSESSGGSTRRGISIRYRYPRIPNETGDYLYYFSHFSETRIPPLDLKEMPIPNSDPPQEPRIQLTNSSEGGDYCFSNDKIDGLPTCKPAASSVVQHIKEHQDEPNGRHPVFISALQFNFRKSTSNGSRIVFQGAKVWKAPIVFLENTGELAEIRDEHLIKISYGNAGESCNIQDNYSVGFNSPDYMNRQYYLSGIWSFERTGRSAFSGEGTTDPIQTRLCGTDGVGQYFCNLFADKVTVWHSVLMPLLYRSGRVSHRQFPDQVVSDGQVVGTPAAAETSFGRYATTPGLRFVNVPEGASPNAIIGKTNNAGDVIPNWDKYFITKLCLTGYRVEKNNAGEECATSGEKAKSNPCLPLVHAMRFELRSPYIKKR